MNEQEVDRIADMYYKGGLVRFDEEGRNVPELAKMKNISGETVLHLYSDLLPLCANQASNDEMRSLVMMRNRRGVTVAAYHAESLDYFKRTGASDAEMKKFITRQHGDGNTLAHCHEEALLHFINASATNDEIQDMILTIDPYGETPAHSFPVALSYLEKSGFTPDEMKNLISEPNPLAKYTTMAHVHIESLDYFIRAGASEKEVRDLIEARDDGGNTVVHCFPEAIRYYRAAGGDVKWLLSTENIWEELPGDGNSYNVTEMFRLVVDLVEVPDRYKDAYEQWRIKNEPTIAR